MRLADYCNAEVVDRALSIIEEHRREFGNHPSREHCPHCNYWDNQEKFLDLDAEYTIEKLKLDQLKKKVQGTWNTPESRGFLLRERHAALVGNDLTRSMEVLTQLYREVREQCSQLKNEIKSIAPCDLCILAFNPTGKLRYMGKDISDVGPYARKYITGHDLSETKRSVTGYGMDPNKSPRKLSLKIMYDSRTDWL